MSKKLTDLTDRELGEAVAVHVAGWRKCETLHLWEDRSGEPVYHRYGDDWLEYPRFATSADAVLPLLNKLGFWSARFDGDEFVVTDDHMDNNSDNSADAPTFPRAACIALLRAKGIKEITT